MISFGLLLALWVFTTTALNLWNRVQPTAGATLRQRFGSQSRSYYGMLLAHLGVGVFIVGVTMVKGYQTEKDVRMEVGDTVSIGAYQFVFKGVTEAPGPNYMASRGTIEVLKNGQLERTLAPEKRIYFATQMPMTEAAINTGFTRDLYVSLGEPVDNGAWVVRVYVKPFVDWIWGGCLVMALGGALALSDRRYRLTRRQARRPRPLPHWLRRLHESLVSDSPGDLHRHAGFSGRGPQARSARGAFAADR